ncbi:MAG: DUF2889 domain-containing protein [Firmicutes bacterium]|nr:DUF2889 domain-containing protein [Bacillota bacterium]
MHLHRCWYATLRGTGPDLPLVAETVFLSPELEAAAALRLERGTFRILRATWTVYRGDRVPPESREVPDLVGAEAYFGAGPALKAAFPAEELPRELFAEAVRAAIQGETFLYAERGHASAESYSRYWEQAYRDSCRYYSNLSLVTRNWAEYTEDHRRDGNLFNRFKFVTVAPGGDGLLSVVAGLSDSFHELGLRLLVTTDAEPRISSATARLVRAPDRVCLPSADRVRNLVGLTVNGRSKKDLILLVGGPQGCTHLADLTADAVRAVRDLGARGRSASGGLGHGIGLR